MTLLRYLHASDADVEAYFNVWLYRADEGLFEVMFLKNRLQAPGEEWSF